MSSSDKMLPGMCSVCGYLSSCEIMDLPCLHSQAALRADRGSSYWSQVGHILRADFFCGLVFEVTVPEEEEHGSVFGVLSSSLILAMTGGPDSTNETRYDGFGESCLSQYWVELDLRRRREKVAMKIGSVTGLGGIDSV